MKRIAAIFTFLLAFAMSANAQDSKSMATADEAAKKDAVELTTFLGLTEEQQTNFVGLFRQKHQVMSDPTISETRKTDMTRIIAAKINASINIEQQQKLATNPQLLERLTQ